MNKERIYAIVEDLRGTCKSIEDFLEEGEDGDDPALLEAIDTELFRCAVCEWWCEMSELASCDKHNEDTCMGCCEHGDEEE